jgi:hypothetical protein
VEFQELDGSPYSAHTCNGILEQMRKTEKMKLSKEEMLVHLGDNEGSGSGIPPPLL